MHFVLMKAVSDFPDRPRFSVPESWNKSGGGRVQQAMDILRDIRFGVRAMRRNATLTVVAVSALAVGTGLNTAVFSLVNAVLFKGLPFEDAHEIRWKRFASNEEGSEDIAIQVSPRPLSR
jgi:hypothetical protein